METKKTRNEHMWRATAAALDAVSTPDTRRARLNRVDEYELQGLANSDPFECLMTAVQADLFRTVCVLEDAAKQAPAGKIDARSISDLEPAINRYLAVVSRIARNAQLELRARSARE